MTESIVPGRFPFDLSPRRACLALAAVAIVVSIGFPIYLLSCSRAGVVRYVSDDAYYYFNVARHLAEGEGPTADGITRTTGFHPLYAFLLAGLYRLTNPSLDGFVREAIALNSVCSLLAGLMIGLTCRRWWGRDAGIVAALLWWANPYAAKIAAAGLEGALYALTLSILLEQLAGLVMPMSADVKREDDLPPVAQASGPAFVVSAFFLGIAGGLVVMSRTDSILYMPLVALIVLFATARVAFQVRLLGSIVFGALALAAWLAWAWYARHWTGEYVQGSAAIKMLWAKEAAEHVGPWRVVVNSIATYCQYLGESFIKAPALKWTLSGVPFILPAWRHRRRHGEFGLFHLLWVVPAMLGLAYATLVDRPRTWYFVPSIVMLTILSAGAGVALSRAVSLDRLQALVRRFIGLLPWLVAIESFVMILQQAIVGRSSEQSIAVALCPMLLNNVEPGTRLGCWHSGIVEYYTPGLHVINLDGLANNDILPILRGDKSMNAYWDEMDIQYILGAPREKMGGYVERWNGKHLVGVPPFEKKLKQIVSDAPTTQP